MSRGIIIINVPVYLIAKHTGECGEVMLIPRNSTSTFSEPCPQQVTGLLVVFPLRGIPLSKTAKTGLNSQLGSLV